MKTLLLIALSLILTIAVSAQEHRKTHEQRRERIETVIIGKFAEELELTTTQAEKFYPRLRQFRNETDESQNELSMSRAKLDDLSRDSKASAKEVQELITRTKVLQTDILSRREAMLTDLSEFLTPQQVSRCSVLLDELPRRLRQLMEERGAETDAAKKEPAPARRRRFQ